MTKHTYFCSRTAVVCACALLGENTDKQKALTGYNEISSSVLEDIMNMHGFSVKITDNASDDFFLGSSVMATKFNVI
jgi:hypothetical protein